MLAVVVGCRRDGGGAKLEKSEEAELPPVPVVPVPDENGPRLGAVASIVPVFDRPSKRGTRLGYLHAGETVARATTAFSTKGCEGGWYPVRPRGFVCNGPATTLDSRHPTLVAMGRTADPASALPYTYARTVRDTTLYEADPDHDGAARALGEVRARSGLALVGSWNAKGPDGRALRLAMTTDGRFVPADDLESAAPSSFRGAALDDETKLPLAFVVKRGVHAWKLSGDETEKSGLLDYHARVDLTGKFRTLSGVEFWATTDGRWVRLRDVTVVRERHEFPAFATEGRRWIDVSVVTGTLVAYEGRRAVYATLASVGRDRLGAPDGAQATTRGEHQVVEKHVTLVGADPAKFADGVSIYDVPWALELSSGQYLLGAYWHDRFGIEHGPGNVEVSPEDAAALFRFATPELSAGFHGVTAPADEASRTIVNVRK